ncbi:MAG: ligase-associated DNA damage response endonuclease PdeM [Paracoccaceae bacterium]
MHDFNISGNVLTALASGALWWAEERILTVSDLHFGKSERISRRGGPILPPYEVRETLSRLERDIEQCGATTVICLGDSFDDLQATTGLRDSERLWIARLQAGRNWIWIEGNHDPGPVGYAGSHLAEFSRFSLSFRHIAASGAVGEVSGHFHPKHTVHAKGRSVTRPCFIYDACRVILPAYGTYTGGLRSTDIKLRSLFGSNAMVVTTGKTVSVLPLR